jgi:hypothetical protein
MEAWRVMGDPLGWRPPLSTKVSAGWHGGMVAGQSKESEPLEGSCRSSEPLTEAGEPSAGSVRALAGVCPPHRGWSWSHHPRSRATQRECAMRRAAPRRIVKKRGHSSEEVRVRNQMGKESLPGLRRYCRSRTSSLHLPPGHF